MGTNRTQDLGDRAESDYANDVSRTLNRGSGLCRKIERLRHGKGIKVQVVLLYKHCTTELHFWVL
jgi:hypothetical protein